MDILQVKFVSKFLLGLKMPWSIYSLREAWTQSKSLVNFQSTKTSSSLILARTRNVVLINC